ncbi:MAG: alpha/beta fold hydrolase [Desulfofustis sp.]
MLHEYDFNSRYLALSQGRLHYLDEGEGDTVVLVHGNPTWSYYYRNLLRALSRRFRVIVPDHMGCGLSDKPSEYDYTLENHIANLQSLLEYLGVSRTSMVVHDWGGPIGIGAAADERLDLERLAILNTAAFRATRIPLRISLCRWPVIGKLLVQGLNAFAGAALFMAVTKKMNRQTAEGYLHPYSNWRNRRAIYEFVKDIPLQTAHRSYETLVRIEKHLRVMKESDVAAAIFWGGKDFCFNDYYYEQWKTHLPQAEFHYYPDWGHYLLEDGKGEIEKCIEEFLSKEMLLIDE